MVTEKRAPSTSRTLSSLLIGFSLAQSLYYGRVCVYTVAGYWVLIYIPRRCADFIVLGIAFRMGVFGELF